MTKLVICCDGTWNDPDEERHEVVSPTNVAKVALGLAPGPDQVLHYEAGVGTYGDDHLLGGAFGLGLTRNVLNAYRFLAENYHESDDGSDGDEIYIFGFSRGAYTARSLAGLIHNCGILKDAAFAADAFELYRDRTSSTDADELAARLFRREYSYKRDTIRFIGVWDTVGALGIPDNAPGWEELSKVYRGWERLWGFHDTQLGPHVEAAYHAISIDEDREAYRPTLWTSVPDPTRQTLEQVWFSGVHTEVGGGSASHALSDIALIWLVQKAIGAGLQFRDGWLIKGGTWDDDPPDGQPRLVTPNPLGPLIDSLHGAWKLMGSCHRLAQPGVADAPCQSVSSSAVKRLGSSLHYNPPGLSEYVKAKPVTSVID